MKLISEHIQLLLHRNDCVVVPGLGGFILNHYPAGYDEKQGRFYPAHSLPFFNKQLQSNDGLLAASLVQKGRMEYTEALTEIRRFASLVNDTLADGRDYVLQGLGTFQRNHEGQITFHPDSDCNLHIDSYGLESLAVKPMLKASEISRKALAPVRKKSRAWISMAASLAILVAAGWWLNYSVQTPFGHQWSMLNPFEWEVFNRTTTPPEVPASQTPDASAEVPLTPKEEISEVESPQTPVESASEPEYLKEAGANDSLYLIVVGAFKNSGNALKYEQELKKSGFSALRFSGTDSELIRVCAEQHTARFEAEERLPFIQSNAQPNAWILAIAKDRVN